MHTVKKKRRKPKVRRKPCLISCPCICHDLGGGSAHPNQDCRDANNQITD
jgi:hypothetical protein